MHEQSETIQGADGRWVNVYGKGLPQAGQQLPGTQSYTTVDEAVTAAKARSAAHREDDRAAPVADGEPDDVSNAYMVSRADRGLQAEADQAKDWAQSRAMALAPAEPLNETNLDPFATDREAPAAQSPAGGVMRNLAEIPRAAALGVDSAIRNATDWAIGPLVGWLNKNVADLEVPVRDVQTPTGKVTKAVSEFLTGFVPALKGMGMLGVTGKVMKPLTASAVADFATRDPHEARLSNLWKEMGLPDNVLTDYLAAKPDDGAIEGRFKSAVESVLTGTAVEGVIAGARALRAAKSVGATQAVADRQLIEKYGELTEAEFTKAVGDPSKPMIETRVKAPPKIAGKVAGKAMGGVADTSPDDIVGGRGVIDAGDMKVYVNFERMGGPDDVKAAIAELAERGKSSIDEATRGTITHAETAKMADELGMTVAQLLERRRGQPFNAEEALAARQLWQASGEQLLAAAKRAAGPNASALDQYAFRKQMAVHHAIQAEVMGARTETARALSAWRIEAGGNVERARALDQVMTAMGGPDVSQQMAKRLAVLATTGDPAAVAKFVAKGWGAKTVDVIKEVWINGLLSSPATHAVNVSSNMAVAFQSMLERGVASRIGDLTGAGGNVAPGEAASMAYGLVTGIKDAFRLSWQAFKTGDTGAALNKIDLPPVRAISSEAWMLGSETGLGRAVDFMGEAARVPSRFLGAEDEFFKTIGYRMELHAQALRMATAEGAKGPALAQRMRQILLDPPENLRIQAADAALYQTFSNQPGNIGQAFMGLREKVPALTFVLPFVKTPVNIARYTFERSPIAPLVGQWRDDIAAGGARADLAMAKMATGTSMMLVALDWADSGMVSGKGPGASEKGEREAMLRQGWQPYSLKVGDRWYSYNRLDPFGALMGFAADSAEAIRRGEMNEDDVDEWQELMAMAIGTVSQVAVNKTYMRGFAEAVQVVSDPTRYGERYINNFVASFVPYTALAGSVERAVDPVARETQNPWEAVHAKLAGLSEALPARRSLWGEEVRSDGSQLGKAYDFFSPVAASKVKGEPIDTEIMRLAPLAAQDNVEGSAPTRIAKRSMVGGVMVNFKQFPEVYDQYVRLAGNELEHPAYGMGAKDFLNAVVQGKHAMSKVYETRSDEMKIVFIKQVVQQYRRLAQQAILADPGNGDFAAYVQRLQESKREARLPAPQ